MQPCFEDAGFTIRGQHRVHRPTWTRFFTDVITVGSKPRTPHDGITLTSEAARRLADVLVTAADEVDGWVDTDERVSAVMDIVQDDSKPYQIADAHRRIRNILDQYPASAWTLEESQAVLSALAGIVRARQSAADEIDGWSTR
jgi:DNA repair ATPase RecN